MGIFGRVTARQRLRKATEESFTVPTFTAPLDCSPWIIGGLWPAELAKPRRETTTLAEYLKNDLQRIAATANDELRAIGQAGMAYTARRAAEARVIDEARALAVRRVESTLRQLRQTTDGPPNGNAATAGDSAPQQRRPEPATTQSSRRTHDGPAGSDMDKTQVLPAVRDEPAAPDTEIKTRIDLDKTRVIPAVRDELPPADTRPAPLDEPESAPSDEQIDPAPDDDRRLQRLLAFVARQEPRLSWAVGDRDDGTTVLTTDLAHGWIPPGIALPAGVRLLEPATRSGPASELLGPTVRAASYAPGDSAKLSAQLHGTPSSVQPMELPAVGDLGWELGVATHWRDGLPRLVNTLAKAAAAGAEIVDQELDLLRVHLDTARYQVLAQYPDVDSAQLLNCMLLAATEGSITGDTTAANYHFAWFQKLEDRAPEPVQTMN